MAEAAGAGAAAGAAASAHEHQLCWDIFKHQIRLTVGLLRSQTSLVPSSFLNDPSSSNVLISPHSVVSSLASLVPGKDSPDRVLLTQTLLHHKITGKMGANEYVGMHCRNNRFNLKKNKHCLQLNTFQYRDPESCPIKPNHRKKLWKKYRCTGKELPLMTNGKPILETLKIINTDLADNEEVNNEQSSTSVNGSSPLLSTAEYVTLLVNRSVDTLLVQSVHFKGVWSKPFELQYGLFRSATGQSVKTEMLYKRKSFLYYEDPQSMCKAIRVNMAHTGNTSMVLILPEENISLAHLIHNLLDYDTLKRILKRLNTRFDVALTMPKFSLTSNCRTTSPVTSLKHVLQLDQLMSQKQSRKRFQYESSTNIDERVILVQRLSLEVSEQGVSDNPGLKSRLFSHKEAEFKADRPFLFLLVTNGEAQQIILAGVCNDPKTSICSAGLNQQGVHF